MPCLPNTSMLTMQKIEHWLFLAFIFCIPFQARIVLASRIPFNEWTGIFLWGTDIIFALLIISNFQPRRFGRGPDFTSGFQISKKDWLLILFLAIAAISIFQAQLVPAAVYRFIKLFEYVLVFFYFRHRAKEIASRSLIVAMWVVSCAVQASIGILQIIFQRNFGLWFLGESLLDVNAHGVAVVAVEAHKFLRAYGTTPHPNVLALLLMIGLWGALWLYTVYPDRRTKIGILVAYAIILFAFLLTFSRTVIVAWILATLAMVVIVSFRKEWKNIVYPLTVTMLTVLLFLALFWPQVHSRLRISADDEAISQRLFYMEIGTASARQNLLRGIGIGQFVPHFMQTLRHYPAFMYQPVHNAYLLILDELGLLGLLFFFGFLASLFWRSVMKNPFLVAGFAALLFLGLFDHYFWTLQQGGLVFWGLLGFLASDTM